MQFTANEFGLCNLALRTVPEKNNQGMFMSRDIAVDQMEDAMSVFKKIKVNVEGDKFIDGEADFSTSEKSLLLKLLGRPWDIENTETFMSLKAKLS